MTRGDNSKSKKARVVILVFLTHGLILFYVSTKYHQNIVKGILVTERTRNEIQTQKWEITLKV